MVEPSLTRHLVMMFHPTKFGCKRISRPEAMIVRKPSLWPDFEDSKPIFCLFLRHDTPAHVACDHANDFFLQKLVQGQNCKETVPQKFLVTCLKRNFMLEKFLFKRAPTAVGSLGHWWRMLLCQISLSQKEKLLQKKTKQWPVTAALELKSS